MLTTYSGKEPIHYHVGPISSVKNNVHLSFADKSCRNYERSYSVISTCGAEIFTTHNRFEIRMLKTNTSIEANM